MARRRLPQPRRRHPGRPSRPLRRRVPHRGRRRGPPAPAEV